MELFCSSWGGGGVGRSTGGVGVMGVGQKHGWGWGDCAGGGGGGVGSTGGVGVMGVGAEARVG